MTAAVAGALVFMGSAAFAGAVLASAAGALRPWVSVVALLLGALAGLAAARAVGSPRSLLATLAETTPWDRLALACFTAASLRQFLWLCYERAGALYTLLPNNYGDLPLHWTYVRYLANGAPFWPENPIATGERLRYPFGVDLFTALFVQAGASLPALLPAIGVLASLLAAAALFGWGRGFAVAAFLFSGGLGDDVAWKNLFLALYVPQRGFLFALPAGLLLLASGRERLTRGGRGLPAVVEGVLWGVLPLFHLHTFLLVSVVLGFWAVATGRVRAALPALGVALLPATWGVWQVTDGFRAAALVWWKPGWTMEHANPIAFLAVNFGVLLPLVLWALFRAVREGSEHRLTLAPGVALFVVTFFVMLAPWDWDNTKVMLWCFLLLLPGLEALVLDRLRPPLRLLALLGLLAPGAVAVLGASRGPLGPIEILDIAETDGVCRGLSASPMTDRVATAPTFNHPVALCGHPLVAGYAGHLWSHGIQARPTQVDLEALLNGAPDWRERARRTRARLIFWGPREASAFPESRRPWEETSTLVAQGKWGRLYSVGSGALEENEAEGQ